MILSDRGITAAINNGNISLKGPRPARTLIQPASIEVTLDRQVAVLSDHPRNKTAVDAVTPDGWYRRLWLDQAGPIRPGELWLASTRETIHLGPGYAAQVGGKSSLGRLGLTVHQTAGFIDPGFHGQITLELVNLGGRPITLTEGMRIAQLTIWTLDQPAERPYGHHALGSHYQNQAGPTAAGGHK